jgi:hypothetical protein
MDRSAKQRAENESTFRKANESLENKASELGYGVQERTPYLCECENERCTELIALSRAEYERVRANPRTFVVTPGHHEPDYDELIHEEARFAIIEKTGEEGGLVAEQDPRTDSETSSAAGS